jgi:hypothetical protein
VKKADTAQLETCTEVVSRNTEVPLAASGEVRSSPPGVDPPPLRRGSPVGVGRIPGGQVRARQGVPGRPGSNHIASLAFGIATCCHLVRHC